MKLSAWHSLWKFIYLTRQLHHSLVVHLSYEKSWICPCELLLSLKWLPLYWKKMLLHKELQQMKYFIFLHDSPVDLVTWTICTHNNVRTFFHSARPFSHSVQVIVGLSLDALSNHFTYLCELLVSVDHRLLHIDTLRQPLHQKEVFVLKSSASIQQDRSRSFCGTCVGTRLETRCEFRDTRDLLRRFVLI